MREAGSTAMRHHRNTLRRQQELHDRQSSFKKSSTEKTLHRGNKEQSLQKNEGQILSIETLNHTQRRNDTDELSSYSDDEQDDEWSDSSSWQSFVHHDRLDGQTTDPDALRWDKAVDSFRWGVQQVRAGRVLEGAVAICTSILMDSRSYKACQRLPPQNDGNDNKDDGDDDKRPQEAAAASNYLLDESLAQTLLQHQTSHVIIQLCASMIVAMRTEQWKSQLLCTRRTTTTPFSQQQQILRMIDTTKGILSQRPNVVEIVDNGFCWNLEHWHFWWAMRYLAVDRDVYWRKALFELERALEHNPGHARARYHIALLSSQYNNDDMSAATLYKKWKNYIQVAHFEDFYLHDAYIWMAYLVQEMNNENNNSDDSIVESISSSSYYSGSSSFISFISFISFSSSWSQNDIDDSNQDEDDADDDADDDTTTKTTNDFSLFSKASDYLQASDVAFRRHVYLYNFVATRQEENCMLWFSSNRQEDANNTTVANIMKKKAKTIARLRSHPNQRPWVKYWTVAPP